MISRIARNTAAGTRYGAAARHAAISRRTPSTVLQPCCRRDSAQRHVGVAALPPAVAVGVDEDRARDRERGDPGPVPLVALVAAGLLERQRGVAVGGDPDPGVGRADRDRAGPVMGAD